MILECLRPAPEDRPADAALVFSGLKKKPMRKAPLLALLLVGRKPAWRCHRFEDGCAI